MTYIEFFDKTAIENIIACVSYIPERVIFIGDNSRMMKNHIERYRRVFEGRGYTDLNISFKTVSKSNLDNAVELLTEIVMTYDDCVFDITGGEEILHIALGIVYERYPDKNIRIHRMNLRNNEVAYLDKDGKTTFSHTPSLTAEENIRIYGGDVAYGDIDDAGTYKWELTDDFIEDINNMWDICRDNPKDWNFIINVFNAVESVGAASADDVLVTVASRKKVEDNLCQHRLRYEVSKEVVGRLLSKGLLASFNDEDADKIVISYKSRQVKKCLTKAGQALEMKIFLSAMMAKEEDGSFTYNDAVNGVVIDWDGNAQEDLPGEYSTINEIDIMLMHGLVPVFISCKNGLVTMEELYKLSSVAHRFGGEYAKKVLVATSISKHGSSAEYFRQRAQDMNIRLIEDIQDLTDDAMERRLRNLWRN